MTAVDLLTLAVAGVRPMVADTNRTTKERVRILWSAVKRARRLASSDVVTDAFVRLAIDAGLIDSTGRWIASNVRDSVIPHGREDIEHVIRWGLRGWNPFEKGPLT